MSESGTYVFATEAALAHLSWRHLITASRRVVAGVQEKSGGHTTWFASAGPDVHAAITWEWAVIDGGSIVFADILAVESNLYPTNANGSAMSPSQRRILLTTIVNEFGWEGTVLNFMRHHAWNG